MNKNKVIAIVSVIVSLGAITYVIIANERRKRENKALKDNVTKMIEEYGVIENH